MQYLISFLEGIITFISPCLLPLLPVYISYFAGESGEEGKLFRTLRNALAFVCGFGVIFVALGAFAGTVGSFLIRYKTWVNLVTGLVVVVFGLNFLGVFRIGILNQSRQMEMKQKGHSLLSSFLFGIVFSIGWTPCVGAFLGSALMLASQQGSVGKGVLMLVLYTLGLGSPFVASAILIDRLKTAFGWIKRHYDIITKISGALLVLVGIFMCLGWMDRLLSLLSF